MDLSKSGLEIIYGICKFKGSSNKKLVVGKEYMCKKTLIISTGKIIIEPMGQQHDGAIILQYNGWNDYNKDWSAVPSINLK